MSVVVVAVGVVVVWADALLRQTYGYIGYVWETNRQAVLIRWVSIDDFDSVAIWSPNEDVSLLNEAAEVGFVNLELDVGSGPLSSPAKLVGNTEELQKIRRLVEENMADRIARGKKLGNVPRFLDFPYRSMDLLPSPVLRVDR